MAFVSSGLFKLVDLTGPSTRGGGLWSYTSSDPHATVEAQNYLAGAGFGSRSTAGVGMCPGDIVIVKNVSTAGTSGVTVHAVSGLSTGVWSGAFLAFNSPVHASISVATT